MIGQTLGHYRIVEKIGAGGMGEVYRAHDEKLERDVALKVLPAGMLADEAARKRFRKEALVLGKLNHPNIETIYEFASQDGVDFLAMELVAGITLSQKLTGGPLADKEILQLGAQIVEGLSAAHEKGIVHCDLKPANVMVSSSGRAKVLDFGLAKFFHTANESSITESAADMAAAGTLPYMSPEQLRGERVDFRSDIYGAGTLLYEMSTGQRPFPETNAPRLIDDILHHDPKTPSAINHNLVPGFDSVVLKSLDKVPDRRYQSAKELAVDLGRLSFPALQIPAPRSTRNLKTWLFAAAATILIVGIVLTAPSIRRFVVRHKAETVERPPSPNFTNGKRLAIFPFEVEGDRASLSYIADGLAESLGSRLSQLSALNVAPSDAVSQADFGQSLDKVGRLLGANLILRGLVRGSPQGLRIVVKLQNISDAQPFWTHELSEKSSELLHIEDQVYGQVLAALAIHETDEERFRDVMRPEVSEGAYDLYLRGRERMGERQEAPDPDGAIHFYEEALKQQRDFELAYVGLADANVWLYQKKKDKLYLRRALNSAQRAVQLNDASPTAHSTLGSVYRTMGKYSEAVAELNRALSLAPNSDDFYRRLGRAYLDSGNTPQALVAFQKAIQLNPYYWVNHNALGVAYVHQGDFAKALQAFQQVRAIEPDIVAGYENIGNIYLQQGKYQESIPYFQKAIQIEPYFSTYSNLGTSYFFLKQYSNAVDMFEKGVTANRGDTQTMVNMADSYRGAGQPDKARAAYQRAIYLGNKELETNPKNPDAMAEIALSYAKVGNASEAQNFIRQARAIDKTNVSYIYYEAEIDALLGRSTDALKLLREALEKHFPVEFAAGDDDLGNLQKDPRFNELIQKYSEKPH
jgi:serine/threonine protein kinase/tetratricopeptide (TPR) repeat protein